VIHRRVRLVEHHLCAGRTRLGDRHTYAGGDGAATGTDGTLQARLQPGCDVPGLEAVDQIRDQHDELVTSDPGQGVHGSEGGPEPLGHSTKDVVSDAMPTAVVDPFEPVEVDEQDTRPGSGTGGLGQCLLDPVDQQHTVG
jgi:hypothetical protein